MQMRCKACPTALTDALEACSQQVAVSRCVRGMNASARGQRLPRFEARESGAAASLANSCASA